LQGSAFGGLMVRALERSAAPGMVPARLSVDLWRPVTRERLTASVAVLREGRKARTVEASLTQADKSVARCTAVYLKADASFTPAPADRTPPAAGPHAGRPIPEVARRWSPFFTGVDTRTVEGDLLKPGPAACWFNLPRAPWILLSVETRVGDAGTGVARGTLSDVDGAFGACEQTLLFENRA
jgi:acyl-CoA thioesterase